MSGHGRSRIEWPRVSHDFRDYNTAVQDLLAEFAEETPGVELIDVAAERIG
jgi:hypothetical protein